MLAQNILSAFLTDSGLDFDLFENLIETSDSIRGDILDLDETNLNLLFKLLIDSKRPSTLGKLIALLEDAHAEYNSSIAILGLIKFDILTSPEDLSSRTHLLSGINKKNAFCLKPHLDLFPEKYQQIIEASVALQRQANEAFREDLKDQIEFLKSEQLTDKALEIEQKLKFHFPEITESFLSTEQVEKKSKEHNFAKVIERNISFEARSKSRNSKPNKREETLKSEAKASLELANLWYTELKDSDPELLLTQLEFIDFDDPAFYSKILKEAKLDIWTKAFLYIKSKNFLEGLNFLSTNESALLTDSSDSIYNYYYTKGVMLLGAGMQKEAEEILLIIKDQKENFRDIQLLLQNAK
ncbi:MAG: hypothetical protein ACRBBP_03235 [Bdellovibrionales bacterium]